MTIFIQTFRFASEPLFFAQAGSQNNKEIFARVMKLFIIVCLFIFLGVMLNITWIKYFIGELYWPGLHVVPVLLAANLCLGIYLNQSMWYKLSGQTKYGAYISLAGALVTLVLNILLIPVMGFTGAAITTLVCYASMMVISYMLSRRYYFIDYDFKNIGFFVLLTAAIYAVSMAVEKYSSLSYGSLQAVNIILLLLFLYITFIKEIKGKKLV